MTSAEIDTAMRKCCPVEYGGTRYCRIVEYVSWHDHRGTRQLSAVLLAEQGNYTVRVPAEKVKEANHEAETEID